MTETERKRDRSPKHLLASSFWLWTERNKIQPFIRLWKQFYSNVKDFQIYVRVNFLAYNLDKKSKTYEADFQNGFLNYIFANYSYSMFTTYNDYQLHLKWSDVILNKKHPKPETNKMEEGDEIINTIFKETLPKSASVIISPNLF